MIKQYRFSFFDVETTGLSSYYSDRICEVGILQCDGFDIVKSYKTLVNPQRNISSGASAVNGITNDMVKEAPVFGKVAKEILQMLEGTIIVCHNTRFDMQFLQNELELLRIPMINNKTIDTLQIARKYFEFPSNSLPNIAGYLKLKSDNFHRALDDVHTTRNVLMHFSGELSKKGIDISECIFDLRACLPYVEKSKHPPAVVPPEIEELINKKKKITIEYISASGEITQRIVEPKQLTYQSDYLYLIGYCYLRGEERIFRLDRIIKMKPAGRGK